jgi:hypothetical protein
MDSSVVAQGSVLRRIGACSACAVALGCAWLALASAAMGRQAGPPSTSGRQVVVAGAAAAGGAQGGQPGALQAASASATLEQCVRAAAQSERSAVFAGEMTAMQGSVRMAIRIEIQELTPGEAAFHTITAPGLGVWRSSDPGIKAYKYVKQVTNLFAPASYRAVVRFRWLNAKGHEIKSTEKHTLRCEQPSSSPVPAGSSLAAGGASLE